MKTYYISKYQVMGILESLDLILKHTPKLTNKDTMELSTTEYKALMKIRELKIR